MASIILLLIGIGLCSFGYWGMLTADGHRAYDEMDGMYPFFALVGGSVLVLAAIVLFLLDLRKRVVIRKD